MQLSTDCCQYPPKGLGTDKTVETTWRRRTHVNTRHVHAMQKRRKKGPSRFKLFWFDLWSDKPRPQSPQKPNGLLETGKGGGGERVSGSTTRSDPESPRRPWTTARTTTMLRQWGHSCCFNRCVDQSHKDSIHSTAVEEQLKLKKFNFLSPTPPPCS